MARTVGLLFKEEPKGLGSLTVDQLKTIAGEKGLEFDPKIRKADLIALIESVEDADDKEDGE